MTAGMEGMDQDKVNEGVFARCDWMWALRACGVLVGCAVIALGVLAIVNTFRVLFDIGVLINGIYQVIFGFLIIPAELRLRVMLGTFAFIQTFIGLGAFYIFVGFLTFPSVDSQWYHYITVAAACAMGVTYIGLACCFGHFITEKVEPPTMAGAKEIKPAVAGASV